ncbi:MAG: prenyltransferase/squalene oxidase repeat-containing protein [Solirubrobacterales bacterium]
MSWQLVSFLILGSVLLAGFAWYERSRPPSQVLALVAALAALAIAGRIAFAAFPNVKPTTDIVIFAGYALGPAPGFAVGALSGLVSNFWFGQGPWTPWQMAAWGLCGVLGALLALGVRNAGRLTLAAVCGFAGIAYGALLNFSLMATYGGQLSLQRFLILEGRAVPFDAAHAIGNVVFALLAGPAMVRMLARFRRRFEWGRSARAGEPSGRGPAGLSAGLRGGGIAVALILALALTAAQPARAEASDVSRAVAWMESVQNPDGGFGASPGDHSSTEITGWAMLGLEAAGRNPLDLSSHGNTPVAYLRGAQGQITSTGDLARTILALEGAGVDPRSFAGRNLVAELTKRPRRDGSVEGKPPLTAFAVIALRAAGISGGLEKSREWLRGAQNSDGGWGNSSGSPSTPDDTGAVLQALAGGSKPANSGLSYLRGVQRSGGGFSNGDSTPVNTQSTAWAIQGIRAAGANPDSFRRGGASAPDYLSAQQAGDGHYRYSGSNDQTPIWVTGQVLVAAAGKSFPVPVAPRESQPAPSRGSGSGGSAGSQGSSGIPLPQATPTSPSSPAQGGGLAPGVGAAPGGSSSAGKGSHLIPGGKGGVLNPTQTPPSTTTPSSASPLEAGSPASPWPPILIGVASGGLALAATWWLARRNGW